jgi:hypothetical protein
VEIYTCIDDENYIAITTLLSLGEWTKGDVIEDAFNGQSIAIRAMFTAAEASMTPPQADLMGGDVLVIIMEFMVVVMLAVVVVALAVAMANGDGQRGVDERLMLRRGGSRRVGDGTKKRGIFECNTHPP